MHSQRHTVSKVIVILIGFFTYLGSPAFAQPSPHGQYYVNKRERSKEQFEQLLSQHGPLHIDVLRAQQLYAEDVRKTGGLMEAYSLHREILTKLRDKHAHAYEDISHALYYTAYTINRFGAYDVGERYLAEARQTIFGKGVTDVHLPNKIMIAEAVNQSALGNHQQAYEMIESHIQFQIDQFGATDDRVLETEVTLWRMKMHTDPDAILPISKTAILERRLKANPTGQSLSLAGFLRTIAVSFTNAGDFRKAREYFSTSRELIRGILGKSHPMVSSVERDLAVVLFKQGFPDGAQERLNTAKSILVLYANTINHLDADVKKGFADKIACVDNMIEKLRQDNPISLQNCSNL